MHPKEREIREVVMKAPFVPFTLVTASGERYKVPTSDHISFFPDTDEDGVLQTEEERLRCFMVFGKGVRHRILFSIQSRRSISVARQVPSGGNKVGRKG